MKKIFLIIVASLCLVSCGQTQAQKNADAQKREFMKTSIRTANKLVNLYNQRVELNNMTVNMMSDRGKDFEGELRNPLNLTIDTIYYFRTIDEAKGKKLEQLEDKIMEITGEIIDSTSKSSL